MKFELESTIAELNEALAAREGELRDLRNELATVDQLKSQVHDLEEILAAKSREIEKLNGSKALAEKLQEQVRRLESQPQEARELEQLHRELAESREELGRVNRELEEALALNDNPAIQGTPLPTKRFLVEGDSAGEVLRVDLNSSHPQRDDLKLIKGVGKVMEQKLHEYGVYRFQQIGQWTDSVIEDFTDSLPFGNRVTRDDWVSQARELHREKYGEAV